MHRKVLLEDVKGLQGLFLYNFWVHCRRNPPRPPSLRKVGFVIALLRRFSFDLKRGVFPITCGL